MPTKDLVDIVREDHEEIRREFERIEALSTAEAKANAARDLISFLVAHETAEQELVHPLARQGPNGDQIVEARLKEEQEGEERLAELERIDVDTPDFDVALAKLKKDVLEHADNEEEKEHPRLREAVDEEHLQSLASVFETAKKAAPTHPHPESPNSAIGNLALGPIVAVADRVRDAARSALEKVS
jgi:hypothetical protein